MAGTDGVGRGSGTSAISITKRGSSSREHGTDQIHALCQKNSARLPGLPTSSVLARLGFEPGEVAFQIFFEDWRAANHNSCHIKLIRQPSFRERRGR